MTVLFSSLSNPPFLPKSRSRSVGLLLGFGFGLLDQVHRLGLGVVEGGDLLGVDLGQSGFEVEVARQQPERLHGQLVGAELLGRHVLVDFLEEQAFMFSRLVTSRFTSCLNGIFRSWGRSCSKAFL